MRIAVIDHSFHEKTGSSRFFFDLLGELGEVEVLSDESWSTGRVDASLAVKLLEGNFDRVISYQAMWPRQLLEWLGLEDIVFVPMWDDVRKRSDRWWGGYEGCRFISFSRALSEKLARFSGRILDVQYYPKPGERTARDGGGLRAFFWQRSSSLPWQTIWRTASGTDWERFYLHWALDPREKIEQPSEDFCRKYSVSMSEWFDDRSDLFATISDADVYFAPRLYEGIGMGFLEAMARGQCVVAPDLPTHNEYIESGRNGILYDPQKADQLSFADARALGEAARSDCDKGFAKWTDQHQEIRDFVKAAPQAPLKEKLEAAVRDRSTSQKKWNIREPFFKRACRRIARFGNGD